MERLFNICTWAFIVVGCGLLIAAAAAPTVEYTVRFGLPGTVALLGGLALMELMDY